MSFGFLANNGSGYAQIDTETPRLCMLEKGSFSGSGGYATITFAAPVTTAEPPMIFIQPTGTNTTSTIYIASLLLGSSGNWTGVRLQQANTASTPTGLWFVAAFASRGTDAYGMRLFNSAGALIYDTGAYSVIFTIVQQTWTYAGKVTLDIGAYYKYTSGRALLTDEYYMLNVFALGCQDVNSGGSCGISMDYTNNQSCMWSLSISSPWTDQGNRPLVMAKLVVS